MDGWNTTFLLGRPIFRGYVSFREGNTNKQKKRTTTNTKHHDNSVPLEMVKCGLFLQICFWGLSPIKRESTNKQGCYMLVSLIFQHWKRFLLAMPLDHVGSTHSDHSTQSLVKPISNCKQIASSTCAVPKTIIINNFWAIHLMKHTTLRPRKAEPGTSIAWRCSVASAGKKRKNFFVKRRSVGFKQIHSCVYIKMYSI